MYCNNCGKKIPENGRFCRYCGKQVTIEGVKHNSDELKSLKKRFKDTGNTSIAISVLAVLATFVLGLIDSPFEDVLIAAVLTIPFLIPFYYFGKKLKEEGIDNLKYAAKVSMGMFIYSLIIIFINLAAGESGGWLLFLLTYYYFKSYREAKVVLKNSV